MTTKNGQLNDGREVYLNGHRVVDMASEYVFSKTLAAFNAITTCKPKIKIILFLVMGLKLL